MSSSANSARSRRSKEDRRQQILDKGRKMVIERGTLERIDIRLRDVLDALKLTTGAAYNIWENQEAFRMDLAAEVARNVSFASLASSDPTPNLDQPPLDEVRRMGAEYFEIFVDGDDFFAALHFWGVKELSEVVATAIREGYTANRNEWIEFFAAGLAWAGLEMSDDFGLEDLATAVTMITEGAALRHRFEPEALRATGGSHIYAEMLVAAIVHMTQTSSG